MSYPITFPAGSEAGDALTFNVEIVDDAVVEGSEQFSVSITDNTGTAQPVSGRDITTIAIIDNDFGTLLLYELNSFICHNIFAEVNVGFIRQQ